MATDPALLQEHRHVPWTVDATTARVEPAALDALPWHEAHAELAAIERGDPVNIDDGRAVGHYWLRDPSRAPEVGIARAIHEAITEVKTLAAAVLDGTATNDAGQAFTDVVHVGIGGSHLGPHFVVRALGSDHPPGLPVHFVDNTDPDGVQRLARRLGDRLATTLIVVVSKSGTTVEPRNALHALRRALREAGVRDAPQLVAVTEPSSPLARQALADDWLACLPLWSWVGGRFSVTSAAGLLPAALAGVDVDALIAGAAAMDGWTRSDDWRANPAALLAGVLHVTGDGVGRRSLAVLPYADRLEGMGRWVQQIVMESVGKRHDRRGRLVHQGLTVYGHKGSTDQHAFVQQLRDGRDDALALFVQVLVTCDDDPIAVDGVPAGDHLQGFLLGTRRALVDGGRPCTTITADRLDAHAVGALLALLERTVGLYGALIGVNAYHQPGVEAGKHAARDVVRLGRKVADRLRGGPVDEAELARALRADPLELRYVLRRLALTGRARRVAEGRWSAPSRIDKETAT